MSPIEVLTVAGGALLVIAAAQLLAPRLRLASPLVLVAVGIGVSLIPGVPAIEVEPEWIIAGVLPPLLYSAAVSMPAMDFRREFGAISGLSVLLVLATTLVTGLFFAWAVPGLPLAWGIALGAIVSPTDAVAVSIVRGLGVSPRVVTMLDGESLLNDATALVVLRAAIAAAAGAVSVGGVVGDFAFAVVVAVLIGVVAGRLNLLVRARTPDATVNTVIGFTVPFLASIPAEELGASGLVAAVVAGLVTGRRAPRVLSPAHRLSDAQNWRTIELVLEGAVFLLLGLELAGILDDVAGEATGVGTAALIAAGGLALTILVRAAYVAPLLAFLHAQAGRSDAMRTRLDDFEVMLDDPAAPARNRRGPRRLSERRVERVRTRIRRMRTDLDHLLARPLGWREGRVVIWAGMRGAVTLAAAQTLPESTPSRSLLVLIAFLVAAGSLVVQGATLPRVVRRLGPAAAAPDADEAERTALFTLLREAQEGVRQDGGDRKAHRLAVLEAQRAVLLDARDEGVFSSQTLTAALAVVDADQISVELRGGPPARAGG